MKYIIRTKCNGENQVEILKPLEKNRFKIEWMLTLKKDSEPIVLSEMYNADCFIIANWNAWIRIYNISKKDIIFEKKCDAKIGSVLKISNDKTKLFIAYQTPDFQPILEIISLTDFSTLQTIALPKEVQPRHFTLGPKDKILFYYADCDENKHGYHLLNPLLEKVTYFPMKHPQWEEFDIHPPVISAKHNTGAMPLWDTIEVKKNAEGKLVFILNVMMFNLDNFEIIKHIPVRAFSVDQLSCYDSENEELAENLQSQNKNEDNYKEAVLEFITENIYSIYFDDNNSFWVAFRGGIVRNVTFEGQLSPLLATSSMPNNAGKGIFNFPNFHSHIHSISENTIILKEGYNDYRMTFTEDELHANQEVISKDIIDHELTIITSQEENLAIEESNKVVIKVSDLKSESSYIEALDKIMQLTTTIDEIKSGHLLKFRIKDNQQFEEDDLFFKNAIQIKGATEKVAQIIKNFITYKEADKLYYDDETTALAHAVYFLTAKDENYINLAIQYLSVIDFEHDVYNKEQLIPLLKDTYHKKFGQHIIDQLSKLDEGESWLEGYLD